MQLNDPGVRTCFSINGGRLSIPNWLRRQDKANFNPGQNARANSWGLYETGFVIKTVFKLFPELGEFYILVN
ncbi:hypothetical protein A3860_31405 [Niastella vici]|uniref:Uncharacterized protein n=1 Tax=Niastella vici TaxID=1703345 RepID=A0A1V9FTW2_9BACT|nr:hypothetical protein A3860_31405 [Niastella vici]